VHKDLTRPSRNQSGIRSKSPQPPFSKGGLGGISEICYHFAHNFIPKRLCFFRAIARKKWPLRGSEETKAFKRAGSYPQSLRSPVS